MDVGDIQAALKTAYDNQQVQVQINGVFYEIDRVLKLSDLSDRDENDVVIIRAKVPGLSASTREY